MNEIAPRPGMVIRRSVKFTPGTYEMPEGNGITIAADGIEIDGQGAVLQGTCASPSLPDGSCLYTPGDMGVSRERHSLLMRPIELPTGRDGQALRLLFAYRFWGPFEDPAILEVSSDRRHWKTVTEAAAGGPGPSGRTSGKQPSAATNWVEREWQIGTWSEAAFSLRLTVPASAVDVSSPCFYDAFALLHDDKPVWKGDAGNNWQRWYNTGFSIYRAETKRFFAGVGIRAEGCNGVRLRNVKVRGFLTALSVSDCEGWTIEGNDFSDNYDDPDYGWGDGSERCGAVHLEGVRRSILHHNNAQRVWNGIALRRCSELTIRDNDFSHCSNTCLKMSQSTNNLIQDNNLSWGLRKYDGEVHARDSVSLLVESGSDCNRFVRNDFTHGGDGIFIRVLNAWCSVGNLFEENDCSYANNNAVEAWSPGNTYIRNKANWSSYGFWLGGSDNTTLIGNQAMHNGKDPRNAPEPFGNAGIAVAHGWATGFVVLDNEIEENCGAGIAVAGSSERPARHWVIAGNRIRNNRNDDRGYVGHGIWAAGCDNVFVLGNEVSDNEGSQVIVGDGCKRLEIDSAHWDIRREVTIEAENSGDGGAPFVVNAPLKLSLVAPSDADKDVAAPVSLPDCVWDFGEDGSIQTTGAVTEYTFRTPGRKRVSVVGLDRRSGDAPEPSIAMATRTLCVLPEGETLADCSDASRWRLGSPVSGSLDVDSECSVSGGGSLRAVLRDAGISHIETDFPKTRDLRGFAGIAFFCRYRCELFTHTGARNRHLEVRLVDSRGEYLEYAPAWDPAHAASEDRYDWVYVACSWDRFSARGNPDLSSIARLELHFGPEEASDFVFHLDALRGLMSSAGDTPVEP